MAPVILYSFCFIFVLWLVKRIQVYYSLNQFGGHWSAGWTRLWQFKTQRSGQMHKLFTELNATYGSTARSAPQMLITTDVDLLRRMSAVGGSFVRGRWYTCLKLHPDLDNITSHVDEKIHADLRTRMTPGYAGKDNHCLEQDVDSKLLDLLRLIDSRYLARPEEDVHRTVDLSRVTTFFTLDVISQVAFGHAFGFLEKDEDPFGYIENLEQFLPALILFGNFTELTNIMKIPLIKPLLPKSTDKRGLGRVMGFAQDRVRERFPSTTSGGGPAKPVVSRDDMLQSFIKRGLTAAQLESETLTQITAGSDSTASSLRMTLHFLSTNPRALSRLIGEVEAAIADGEVSRPVIRDVEARRLPYLQACIKEGLRLYPPITGLMAKAVPPGGAWIDVDGEQKFAPEGTQIGMNSWGMMRNTKIFGEDVELFRPERWLAREGWESDRERVKGMTEAVGMCFGSGRFGCLGRGVALMELNKAIVEILLRYNLQPCSLAKPFEETAIGFYIHRDMKFVITEREKHGDASQQSQTIPRSSELEADALPGAYEE
ncbi:cytochrome P450 [Polychaeton citri CBS 116435]|uniref:Cytochrome P450 n=1 Tax=Polychaeton citri CBS 116435 TaxID=1314669 RepID=A0A9P4Q5W2_9PEZI|nr:cytochrome P450 [Polychaeton citri CBS 116435]